MKKWIVYKHTSPSGKVYIGITSNSPEKRWNHGRNYSGNQYFTNAILKYGWNNFKHEIVASNLSVDEAKAMETSLIKLYKDKKISYNISAGGDGNSKPVSKETRAKISRAMKGHKSYERDAIWRAAVSIRMKQNPTLTDKARKKAHENAKRILSKHIAQYSLDGTLIQMFFSSHDIKKMLGFDNSFILKCCKGKKDKAYGYIWKFISEEEFDSGFTKLGNRQYIINT